MSGDVVLRAPSLMVDTGDQRVWLNDTPLTLSQKAFQLLCALMASPERLVSKEALIDQVWEGRAVSDAVLTTAMRELRKALNDKARSPEFIETVHGQGYRFLKPVQIQDAELGSATPVQPSAGEHAATEPVVAETLGRNWTIPALLVVGAFAAALVVWQIMSTRAPTPPSTVQAVVDEASIAVLAFDDLSPDGSQAYFSDGISEEILNSLVKLEGLSVAGRTSSFSFKGTNTDVREIGETLGVAHVLEGSVRTSGNRVRITAQLIKADDGFHLWSEVYEREAQDIFSIQDDIARSVAAELKVLLSTGAGEPIVGQPTEDEEAYRLFLQGRALFARRVGDNIPKAIEVFERAIEQDPEFARAYSALATAYAIQPDYDYSIDPMQAASQAKLYAQRALDLDPALAEPHAALGVIAFDRRDYIASRMAFDRASELDPNDVNVLFWKSILLRSVGDLAGAAVLSDRAMAIDPISPLGYVNESLYKLATGKIAEAKSLAERARDLGHPTGNYILAKIAEVRGETGLAIELHSQSLIDSGAASWFDDSDILLLLAGSYGSVEDKTIARSVIDRYIADDGPKRDIVSPNILLDMGEVEAALRLFEQSGTTLDQFFLLPVWAPSGRLVRQDPYFPSFIEAIGMRQYWDIYGWPDACARTEGDLAQEFICQ